MDRSLAAILAADVVGYSRLMGQDVVRQDDGHHTVILEAVQTVAGRLSPPRLGRHAVALETHVFADRVDRLPARAERRNSPTACAVRFGPLSLLCRPYRQP